ncbi:Di-N-acetylchitobiase-like [Oopsacas minuta]|uniref:Di-N-acetylchitobiase-like n=1 Tax=Oopsacas minuta TaxID=111878 RepID=A0AAV7JET2_9METZ|nr:Di-N-acetylchitobiase-like [Oopsacas minuta]
MTILIEVNYSQMLVICLSILILEEIKLHMNRITNVLQRIFGGSDYRKVVEIQNKIRELEIEKRNYHSVDQFPKIAKLDRKIIQLELEEKDISLSYYITYGIPILFPITFTVITYTTYFSLIVVYRNTPILTSVYLLKLPSVILLLLAMPTGVEGRKGNKIIAVYSAANADWHKYDLSLITEIIVTSKQIDPDLICLAHVNNVQVHYHVKITSDVIYEKTVQDKWILEQVANIKKQNLDGINVNYQEYAPLKKHSLLIQFVKELYTVLKTASSSYELSYSVSWYLDSDERDIYKELSKYVDYFMVREHDMSSVIAGPPCYPAPNAPIYKIMSSLTEYFQAGVPIDHLVASLPWYGYFLTCQNMTSDGRCVLDKCKEELTEQMCYGDVINKYINTGLTQYNWDSISQSPYLSIELPGTNLTGEYWFDNGQSLSIKTQTISRGGYRGVAGYRADCMMYDGSMEVEVRQMWESLAVFQ